MADLLFIILQCWRYCRRYVNLSFGSCEDEITGKIFFNVDDKSTQQLACFSNWPSRASSSVFVYQFSHGGYTVLGAPSEYPATFFVYKSIAPVLTSMTKETLIMAGIG